MEAEMALSTKQVEALRKIAADGSSAPLINGRTLASLRDRFLIKLSGVQYVLTQSGHGELSRHERADREQAERLERLSRPVPASAFVEPSARNPVVMAEDMGNGCDCDRDGCRACFPEPTPLPAVPQSWVDQLLALLDSGIRVEWDGQGWRAHPVPFTMPPARLSATVAHAIASGVVRPTTGLREPVRLVRVASTEH